LVNWPARIVAGLVPPILSGMIVRFVDQTVLTCRLERVGASGDGEPKDPENLYLCNAAPGSSH